MPRHTVLPALVALILVAPGVRGTDSDDVKRMRERIDLLETRLKLAEAEMEAMKKEIEILKGRNGLGGRERARTLSDILQDGATIAGDFRFTNVKVAPGEISLTVKDREGKKFRGTYRAKSHQSEFVSDVEGEITGDQITFKGVKSVHKFTVTGAVKGESLPCTFVDDDGGRAEMTFKLPR